MEERTLRVLEYNRINDMLTKHAVCAEAKQRCGALLPAPDFYEAQKLLDMTSDAEALLIKKALPLSPVKNITASVKRSEAGGVLSMAELLSCAHVLRLSRALLSYAEDSEEESLASLSDFFGALSQNKKLENDIFSAIISDEEMADDASAELLSIRRKMRSLHSKVREELNNMVHSSRYGPFLQEPIVTMRGDRYVIPVKSEHKGEVSGIVHDSSASGATLFIEPMAAVEINNKLHALHAEEKDVFNGLFHFFRLSPVFSASIYRQR